MKYQSSLRASLLLAPTVLLGHAFPALAQTGTTRIANWKDDKKAAFVLMFDDSVPSDITNALPELQKRKLSATFYPNPGMYHYKKNQAQWEGDIPKMPGVAYGNHTLMHDGLKDYASADAELKTVNALIVKLFPGKETRLISWAKPGVPKEKWTITDEDYQKVLQANNLVSRDEPGVAAAQFGPFKTAESLLQVVDGGIARGGKRGVVFHGIGGDWISTPMEMFIPFLDGLVERGAQLWVADHIATHKYETERKTARVATLEATDRAIKLELKSDADPALYDYPLTLVTQVPPAWKQALVKQGSRTQTVAVSNGQAMYEAVPGNETVFLQSAP